MQRIVGAALDGDVGQGRGRRAGFSSASRESQSPQDGGGDEKLLVGEEQILWRQQGSATVAAEQAVARLRVGPEFADRIGYVVVQAQDGFFRQVVEDQCRVFEEQRQVVLDAGGRDAVGDVLVDGGARRVALEGFAVAAAEARAAGLIQRKFARRQQTDLRHRENCALRIDIEAAQGLDLVVEQLDAEGQGRAHREEVDQAAAHAVFARRDDLRDVLVAGQRELRAQGVDVEAGALLEEERMRRQILGRREAVQRRRGRNERDVAGTAADLVERRQALGDQVVVRRERVVGQGCPVRQQMHAQLWREPGDLLLQALRIERVGRDHRQHAARARSLGQRQGVARAGQYGQIKARAGFRQSR